MASDKVEDSSPAETIAPAPAETWVPLDRDALWQAIKRKGAKVDAWKLDTNIVSFNMKDPVDEYPAISLLLRVGNRGVSIAHADGKQYCLQMHYHYRYWGVGM